jgi:hypothetical protein
VPDRRVNQSKTDIAALKLSDVRRGTSHEQEVISRNADQFRFNKEYHNMHYKWYTEPTYPSKQNGPLPVYTCPPTLTGPPPRAAPIVPTRSLQPEGGWGFAANLLPPMWRMFSHLFKTGDFSIVDRWGRLA